MGREKKRRTAETLYFNSKPLLTSRPLLLLLFCLKACCFPFKKVWKAQASRRGWVRVNSIKTEIKLERQQWKCFSGIEGMFCNFLLECCTSERVNERQWGKKFLNSNHKLIWCFTLIEFHYKNHEQVFRILSRMLIWWRLSYTAML